MKLFAFHFVLMPSSPHPAMGKYYPWQKLAHLGPEEIAIITWIVNAHVYIEIINNFLISSIENWFRDDEIIFQGYDTPFQRAKGIKAVLLQSHIKSMTWPMNSLDLNPI